MIMNSCTFNCFHVSMLNQVCGVQSAQRLHIILFKEYFIHAFLYRFEVHYGLSHYERLLRQQRDPLEDIVPNGLLDVPFDHVAPFRRQQVKQPRQISAFFNLIPNERPLSLRLCLHYAIGHNSTTIGVFIGPSIL